MGGGLGGSFGGTKGSNGSFKETLDHISNLLAAASFVPGLDTFTNIASIPVDALRGDWVSTILDIAGVIPVFGEAADFAKTGDKIIDGVKAADKATDSAKIAKKVSNASDYSSFSKNVHSGRQGKHIVGHNNYQKGKSVFNGTTADAQNLIKKYSGTGRKQGANKEIVDFKKTIGKYVDPTTGKSYDTTMGTIHYSKDGAHIVPARPKK